MQNPKHVPALFPYGHPPSVSFGHPIAAKIIPSDIFPSRGQTFSAGHRFGLLKYRQLSQSCFLRNSSLLSSRLLSIPAVLSGELFPDRFLILHVRYAGYPAQCPILHCSDCKDQHADNIFHPGAPLFPDFISSFISASLSPFCIKKVGPDQPKPLQTPVRKKSQFSPT